MSVPVNSAVVVDLRKSRHARLSPVSLSDIELLDCFWAERLRINREITIPGQYQLLEETGRIDNFRRAAVAVAASASVSPFPHVGAIFNDSDVNKWMEAAAWAPAAGPNQMIESRLDPLIEIVAAAQDTEGCVNTACMFDKASQRWTIFDPHEMYCAGHLLQAAVAQWRSTGKRALLEVAIRFAEYLDRRFGSAQEGKEGYTDGHQEVEMALLELYRVTGEQRYLDLALFLQFPGTRSLEASRSPLRQRLFSG